MHGSRKRFWKDRGDSTLISALIVLPMVFAVLWSSVDAFMYFTNRTQMLAVARDGARTVAIMGGDGTATQATPLEKEYGSTRSSLCDGLLGNSRVSAAYNPGSTSNIECNILKSIGENPGFGSVTVENVACDPQQTTSISQRTSCLIQWQYYSVPGSPLGFIKKPADSDNPHAPSGFSGPQQVIGTSESEVDLTDITLVPR